MPIRIEATFKDGKLSGESDVKIDIDVDASQRDEVDKLLYLKVQQQLRLLATWNGSTREMGMVSYDGMRQWGKDGSFTIYFVSDNSSIDIVEWSNLIRGCAGKKNKNRKTFLLTCLTLEEAQIFDSELQKTGISVSVQRDV